MTTPESKRHWLPAALLTFGAFLFLLVGGCTGLVAAWLIALERDALISLVTSALCLYLGSLLYRRLRNVSTFLSALVLLLAGGCFVLFGLFLVEDGELSMAVPLLVLGALFLVVGFVSLRRESGASVASLTLGAVVLSLTGVVLGVVGSIHWRMTQEPVGIVLLAMGALLGFAGVVVSWRLLKAKREVRNHG